MGNCCCERKDDAVFPQPATETQTTPVRIWIQTEDDAEDGNDKLETTRASIVMSTCAGSDSYDGKSVQVMGKDNEEFLQVLAALRSEETLAEVIDTHTWVGIIDNASAAAALNLVSQLQGADFTNKPIVRLAYYTDMKQSKSLETIVSNLHSTNISKQFAFAYLLEVLLTVFVNLTLNLTHDLLALNIFQELESAFHATENPDFLLCISGVLHHMYYKNLFLLRELSLPDSRPLMIQMVAVITRLHSPSHIRIVTEFLLDFVTKYDGTFLEENYKCLQKCGVAEAVVSAEGKLMGWRDQEEVEATENALKELERGY